MKTTVNKKNGKPDTLYASKQYYSLRIGSQALRQLSFKHLLEIEEIIDSMLTRHQLLSPDSTTNEEDYPIHFDKITTHYADNDYFHTIYSMETCDSYLQCISTKQMKKIAFTILTFLNLLEKENSYKKEIPSSPPFSEKYKEEAISIHIQTDPPADNYFLEETPALSQQTHWSGNDLQPVTTYRITANDQELEVSSPDQLLRLRKKLADFLN